METNEASPMLIVAGTIRVNPAKRSELLEAVAPMVVASNAEAGCHAYVFSPDVDDDGLLHLFERWENQAALDAHFASEHMAEWQQRAAALEILERDILKYTIAEVGPVR